MTTLETTDEPSLDALERTGLLFQDAQRRTDEFLATLGHEMRNPLSALSNALHLWPTALHDPVQMEELRHIMLRQVRQLTCLSDDLLDVARIAQGKLELRCEQVGLRQLIDAACEEVRPFIDRCGHALSGANARRFHDGVWRSIPPPASLRKSDPERGQVHRTKRPPVHHGGTAWGNRNGTSQ